MSKDYVADNAGSGFASFDDEPSDLESLLATAALGEEDDDQETESFFQPESAKTPKPKAVYTPKVKEAPVEESTDFDALYSTLEETQVEEKYTESHSVPETFTSSYQEPVTVTEPVEIYEPAPAYEAPVQQARSWERDPNPSFAAPAVNHDQKYSQTSYAAPVTSRAANRIHIPSEAEEITLAGKIIRIVDAYRKLNEDAKTVASQFITNGSEIVENEATLAVKVLNVDPMLPVTMRSLREAKALDPVERVFYVISLNDDVLHSLGGLVSVFTGESLNENDTKINYARGLVREIDQLDSRAVNYVESTESILAAADGESD